MLAFLYCLCTWVQRPQLLTSLVAGLQGASNSNLEAVEESDLWSSGLEASGQQQLLDPS